MLPAIEGLWCMSNEVRVAAAFMSTSPSTSTSGTSSGWGCLRLPLSIEAPFVRRGDAAALPAFAAAFALPACDLLVSVFGEAFAGRVLGEGVGREGAGTGGSLGLCIVRACLVGGGARMEV